MPAIQVRSPSICSKVNMGVRVGRLSTYYKDPPPSRKPSKPLHLHDAVGKDTREWRYKTSDHIEGCISLLKLISRVCQVYLSAVNLGADDGGRDWSSYTNNLEDMHSRERSLLPIHRGWYADLPALPNFEKSHSPTINVTYCSETCKLDAFVFGWVVRGLTIWLAPQNRVIPDRKTRGPTLRRITVAGGWQMT